MALKTQGFSLSALPRSSGVPSNIGRVDVKAINDGIRDGLATFETVRRAPRSMLLADAAANADIAAEEAKKTLIPVQTAATLADTPNRSRVLASQAQIAERGVPLALAQIESEEAQIEALKAAQARASNELAQFTEDYATAKKMAVPATEADELEKLAVKYPWLDVVPEYKQLSARIKESAAAARTAAQKQADREGALEIATLRTTNRPLTGDAYLLNRVNDLRTAIEASPDDASLRAALADATQLLNKKSATTATDPNAVLKNRIDVAKINAESRVNAARLTNSGKAYDAALAKNEKIHEELAALAELENSAEKYLGSALGSGVIVGSAPAIALRSIFGDDTGKNFVASIAQSMKSAVETMRGLGQMSEKEFTAAMAQLPQPNEPESAVRQKIAYIGLIRPWVAARSDAFLDRIAAGDTTMQAGEHVRRMFPMPDPSVAMPKPGTAAPAATAAPNSATAPAQFEVGKVYTDANGNRAIYRGPGQWEEQP